VTRWGVCLREKGGQHWEYWSRRGFKWARGKEYPDVGRVPLEMGPRRGDSVETVGTASDDKINKPHGLCRLRGCPEIREKMHF